MLLRLAVKVPGGDHRGERIRRDWTGARHIGKGRRPQNFGGRTVRQGSDGVCYFLAARTLRMPVLVISDPLKSRFAFAVHPIGAVC
ncbi:hypothetical protein FHR83_005517 [Actinoplanes campanulatus]|uniref:Uncharacterized protein n=1 Tax=Actinoplanes campanulatus TaxID=113559 RepID=A0A7W5AK91_9ACTN|nr:hypothetical protein [Actinoplanes campanulatus]MBB3097833.1 hypothetical protein [Actinoplanes campanulatus]